jgi:hypothetical protein
LLILTQEWPTTDHFRQLFSGFVPAKLRNSVEIGIVGIQQKIFPDGDGGDQAICRRNGYPFRTEAGANACSGKNVSLATDKIFSGQKKTCSRRTKFGFRKRCLVFAGQNFVSLKKALFPSDETFSGQTRSCSEESGSGSQAR